MKNHLCSRFRFFIPIIVIGAIALLALAVYGLWNGVLANVLGIKTVTYGQALGILVLARILFGGVPRGGGGRFGPPWRRRMMMKRWQSLTPEQREQMVQEMRQRFGDWPKPPWCGGDQPQPEKPGEASQT